jgi:hypothetical protein
VRRQCLDDAAALTEPADAGRNRRIDAADDWIANRYSAPTSITADIRLRRGA